MKNLLVAAAALAVAGSAFGQDKFEVASIKETAPENVRCTKMEFLTGGRLSIRCTPMHIIVREALNLPRFNETQRIKGEPEWLGKVLYDIEATAPAGVMPPTLSGPEREARMRKMLLGLLEDRFHFKFRVEKKTLPVYSIDVPKGGLKLKETTVSPNATPEGPPPLMFSIGQTGIHLTGRYATTGELASVMQRAALDRPVTDQTGLTGRYDFDLEFARDESLFGGALGKGPDEPTAPGLFAALQQQLGLKLEATRGPVTLLVIDQVKRPTEN